MRLNRFHFALNMSCTSPSFRSGYMLWLLVRGTLALEPEQVFETLGLEYIAAL